tara:strand:+ start:316 stop:486 length:171 start_codon:yes stop_codon:yes gene_type:complete
MKTNELIRRFYRNYFWVLLAFLLLSIYDSRVKAKEIEAQKLEISNLIERLNNNGKE